MSASETPVPGLWPCRLLRGVRLCIGLGSIDIVAMWIMEGGQALSWVRGRLVFWPW